MAPSTSHEPVLRDRIVELLASQRAGTLIDATVGAGGHAAALLEASGPEVTLVGFDRDPDALELASQTLAPFGDRVELVHAGYDRLTEHVARQPVLGVLYDLGVSSPQLDRPERGFSYRTDAPLDMRMDRSQALSAREVVNDYEEAELARVIARWGEERFARAIARRIAARRPLETTAELAEVVRDAIPAPARRRGPHPARRTFQAIRMEVNAELDHLAAGLDAAFAALVPGGRLVVLSYHSLEDRMVKRAFRAYVAEGRAADLTRKPRTAGEEESAGNRRSRSAKLRAIRWH